MGESICDSNLSTAIFCGITSLPALTKGISQALKDLLHDPSKSWVDNKHT